MIESVEDLVVGLGVLSNHFRKALALVQKNSAFLRERLNVSGMSGRVHLWRKAQNYYREMSEIMNVSRNIKEKKSFLGTYFALQFLQLHFLNIDLLRREATSEKPRELIYQYILKRLRFQLQELISAYLVSLIRVFSDGIPEKGIVLCNVGMILDQDDLDVMVIIDPSIDRVFWNKVISQISNEFLRYSTKMHFYLAERVAESSFLTTISDYKDYLSHGIHNYVLISELLLTEHLIGDLSLIRRIESNVISSFYFDGTPSLMHEGYLRGMMGEVQEMLWLDWDSPWISPKNQALRLIHNVTGMLKTIYGIHERGTREILANLERKDPEHQEIYQSINSTFNFMEMFFYVYQLIVSVDDNINFKDKITLKNLDQVAETMGYAQLGAVRPSQRLMTHYYERMDELSRLVDCLLPIINNHLKKVTIFNSIMQEDLPKNDTVKWSDSIAVNLLKLFKIYRGMVYWDDILQLLGENEGAWLKKLLRSVAELERKKKTKIFEHLLNLLSYDIDSMVMTGVLFSQYVREPELVGYFDKMKKWLVNALEEMPNRMGAFISLINTHPSILTQFLLTLETQQLLQLRKITRKLGKTVQAKRGSKKKFILLCELLAFSSNNYRRFYARVSKVKKEIVTQIDNMEFLESLSVQLWSELSDAMTPESLKEKLAVFYEYSFCRCGLLAINHPGNLELLYGSYHAFFHRYFRWLFHACQWDVEIHSRFEYLFREQDENDQPLAFFCCGGYAREEAFENDIDMFVVCWDSDAKFLKYASRIVNDINRELSRRGVIPHYRFADFFNSYIIPISHLKSFFSQERPGDFIEFSQLLGSKMLVGGHSLNLEVSEILEKHLFHNPRRVIRDLLHEMKERQFYAKQNRGMHGKHVNVKEDPGALRDIQMITSACQMHLGQRDPVIWEALSNLAIAMPDFKSEFSTLEKSYRFIRFFRDTYALSLAGADTIMRDRLLSTAQRMGLETGELKDDKGTVPKLLNSYSYHRSRAKQAIDSLSDFLLKEYE